MKKRFANLAVLLVVVLIPLAFACAKSDPVPVCPTTTGPVRSEKEITDTLAKTKSVTVTDAEATALAKNYLPAEIVNPGVCFTPGLANLSGKINIGPAGISFYVSGNVDLSGNTPKVSGLTIKLGGVPDLGNVMSQAQTAISDAINESMSDITLSKKYNANFGAGSVTVQEVTP